MNKDIIFGFKLAFAIFCTVFSLILPYIFLFYIVTYPVWWIWLLGFPTLAALIALEVCICEYIWEEWIDD